MTVQLLEETLAVLSLGKLCEDHGYSFEWVSGQKPRLAKEEGGKLHAKRATPYLLSFQGYPPVLGAIRRQHRHRRICETKIERGMAIEIRTTVFEIFLSGWRSSQII